MKTIEELKQEIEKHIAYLEKTWLAGGDSLTDSQSSYLYAMSTVLLAIEGSIDLNEED